MKAHQQIQRLILEQLLLQAAMESEFARLLAARESARPQVASPAVFGDLRGRRVFQLPSPSLAARVSRAIPSWKNWAVRKKRVILLCLIIAALALITLLAYHPTSREPSYDGHPLSFWVASLNGASALSDNYRQATNAIEHIGVAALPFLVKWLSDYNPPQWRRMLASKLDQTRNPLARKLSDVIINRPARQVVDGIPHAFALLGKRAMPAFDALCRLMNQKRYTSVVALWSLSHLGTNALPPLLTVATNVNSRLRFDAIRTIGTMPDLGDAAETAIPALTNFLGETENPGKKYAIGTLGSLKAAPEISIPAILPFLKDTEPLLRMYSATALGRFGPQAATAIPALTNALADPDRNVRVEALRALQQIAPDMFPDAGPQ